MLEEPQPQEAHTWPWAAAQGLRVWALELDLGRLSLLPILVALHQSLKFPSPIPFFCKRQTMKPAL